MKKKKKKKKKRFNHINSWYNTHIYIVKLHLYFPELLLVYNKIRKLTLGELNWLTQPK